MIDYLKDKLTTQHFS